MWAGLCSQRPAQEAGRGWVEVEEGTNGNGEKYNNVKKKK